MLENQALFLFMQRLKIILYLLLIKPITIDNPNQSGKKLVEQREEEGTSEELYKQIQEEKAKLIKEGKIKK